MTFLCNHMIHVPIFFHIKELDVDRSNPRGIKRSEVQFMTVQKKGEERRASAMQAY